MGINWSIVSVVTRRQSNVDFTSIHAHGLCLRTLAATVNPVEQNHDKGTEHRIANCTSSNTAVVPNPPCTSPLAPSPLRFSESVISNRKINGDAAIALGFAMVVARVGALANQKFDFIIFVVVWAYASIMTRR